MDNTQSNFDDLSAFAYWWLQTKALNPPFDAITIYGNMTGMVLYRDKCYQVQLFIAQPNSVAPSHIHPNVDSYELLLSGDLDFVINGVKYSHKDAINNKSTPVRIFPSYWHEGITGPLGGSFLSMQKWLNDTPPSCVGKDWVDVNGYKEGNCSFITE